MIQTPEALQRAVLELQLPVATWHKPIEALWKEVLRGESVLAVVETGQGPQLQRQVSVIRVQCYYQNAEGQSFQLHETKQVTKEGVERVRNFNYVAEKQQAGETATEAALRALKEELQLDTQEVQVEEGSTSEESLESPSYQGVQTVYKIHNFSTQISEKLYQPEYQEVGKYQTTYFEWRPT